MRKTYKYRIYLTKGQRRILEQQLEECRWLYNELLATRKRAYEESALSLRLYDLQNMIPGLKVDRRSLTSVHSLVLQNVNIRYDSITYSQYGNGVKLEGDRLILSKVGAVHVVLYRPIEGTPKTVTVSCARTGKWFACFSCEVETSQLHPTSEVVGVDVGLASFATFSTGEQIENPRFYRTDEADLKRVQRRKDAAKQGENWAEHAKQKAIVAKIHERIANRRADFAHKRSRELVDRFQIIAFEALEPQKMGNSSGMRKSIMDVAWSQFIGMTVSKAAEAGRRVILVDPRNTSKMCSRCGALVGKTLSERVHSCPVCGLVMNRDRNAAINILQRGLHTLQT